MSFRPKQPACSGTPRPADPRQGSRAAPPCAPHDSGHLRTATDPARLRAKAKRVDTRKSSALDCRNVKLGKPIMDMERYFVTREHEDLWWVSHRDTNLYSYPTEQEARLAALALAHDAAQTERPRWSS